MRKTILLALLLVCACQLKKAEPRKSSKIMEQRKAAEELQNFKNEVCPAALNGLRAVTQDRVMDASNFRDTTVLFDLRETAAMLEMVMAECTKTPTVAPNTAPTPDSTPEKFEGVQSIRVALSHSTAPTTLR